MIRAPRIVRHAAVVSAIALGLSVSGASAADTLTVQQWSKKVDQIGKKLLCVCHDGSELENYGGTISSASFITPPGAVQVACIIPQFNDPEGGNEQTGDVACYTYTVLN